jgi:hypothetical protein
MSITSKYDLSNGELLLTEVCINHQCKKEGLKISQNDERVVPTGPPHEIEDVFAQYETIEENNMEPMQVIEKVEGTANPRTSSVNSNSPLDRSYLEDIKKKRRNQNQDKPYCQNTFLYHNTKTFHSKKNLK